MRSGGSRVTRSAWFWCAPLLALGCDAFVGSYTVASDAGVSAVSVARLCRIERDSMQLPLDLDSTDDAHDGLEEYYEEASPEFTAHLAAVRAGFEAGEPSARVTYFMGAAAIGKSFATRNLDEFGDDERCDAVLNELVVEGAEGLGFEVELQDDLTTLDGNVVFNRLPGASEITRFDLDGLLSAAGCYDGGQLPPLVVIDGVDEIVDRTASSLLEQVDDMLLARGAEDGFLHVLVAGRPEGFSDWLTDSGRNEDNVAIADRYLLEAPRYDSAGDLDFRLRGYLAFTDRLDAIEARDEYGAHLARLRSAVSRHPFLTYSLGNLGLGNFVIEHTAVNGIEGEEELKVAIFDDLLVRNADTHGRPGAGGDLDAPYRRALEEIAVQYVEVDDDGTFTVRSDDNVDVVGTRGRLGSVRVRDVLDRSGVATLLSVNSVTTRYRFDPFWIHAHLVERRNLRLIADHEYRTCE